MQSYIFCDDTSFNTCWPKMPFRIEFQLYTIQLVSIDVLYDIPGNLGSGK